jgi:hypothetical protein
MAENSGKRGNGNAKEMAKSEARKRKDLAAFSQMLAAAAMSGSADAFDWVLYSAWGKDAEAKDFVPALMACVRERGRAKMLAKILEKSYDWPSVLAKGGWMVLACGSGSVESVALLARAGADIDELSASRGETALNLAVDGKNKKMLEALIAAGANANGMGRFGRTPLMTAARSGSVDIVGVLLDGGADANKNEGYGRGQPSKTALIYAAMYAGEASADIARLLVDFGADMDCMDEGGNTALHAACLRENATATKALLACGANPWLKKPRGQDALSMAVASGCEASAMAILGTLQAAGFDAAGRSPAQWRNLEKEANRKKLRDVEGAIHAMLESRALAKAGPLGYGIVAGKREKLRKGRL